MPRITVSDLISGAGGSGFPLGGGEDWLGKMNQIIAGINQLLQQYNQLRQNLPGISQRQPGTVDPPGGMSPPGGDPRAAQVIQAARLFVGNLQKQGKGDQPIGQVISQIPETVNQLAALLDQLIARSGAAQGIKNA